MTDDGLWAASIFDRAGPIQRIALTQALLDRIARLDGTLHSLAAVTADLARTGAGDG